MAPYFDIKGIGVNHVKINEHGSVQTVIKADSISFSDYKHLNISYDTDYLSQKSPSFHWKNLGFISSAMACDPFEQGYMGSKNERLENLTLITLNDFDEDHLENDTINDLFSINYFSQDISIAEYLAKDTTLIENTFLNLMLKKAPEMDNNLKIKVVVDLSTGEQYIEESSVLFVE